jgi:hypothetical protein
MTHGIQSIEIEYVQECFVREYFNRHLPPVLACTAWVNGDGYDKYQRKSYLGLVVYMIYREGSSEVQRCAVLLAVETLLRPESSR